MASILWSHGCFLQSQMKWFKRLKQVYFNKDLLFSFKFFLLPRNFLIERVCQGIRLFWPHSLILFLSLGKFIAAQTRWFFAIYCGLGGIGRLVLLRIFHYRVPCWWLAWVEAGQIHSVRKELTRLDSLAYSLIVICNGFLLLLLLWSTNFLDISFFLLFFLLCIVIVFLWQAITGKVWMLFSIRSIYLLESFLYGPWKLVHQSFEIQLGHCLFLLTLSGSSHRKGLMVLKRCSLIISILLPIFISLVEVLSDYISVDDISHWTIQTLKWLR